jgi:hypothetical protein
MMTLQQAKEEIISVFSDAAKEIGVWVKDLERLDIGRLLEAAAIVKEIKGRALENRQGKKR